VKLETIFFAHFMGGDLLEHVCGIGWAFVCQKIMGFEKSR